MTELEPLRQFLELARTGSFVRAASASHVSPSTFSRSIQRLERRLGHQLVERSHHQVRLTPFGDELRRFAGGFVEQWDAFVATTGQGDHLSGTLHLYCTVTAAQSIVPDLLSRFRARHPEVRLALETGYAADALEQLRRGAIDVSIAALPDELPAGVVVREVAVTPVVFVGPVEGPVAAMLARPRVDWTRLPMVLPAQGLARVYVDQWFERRRREPLVEAESTGHEAILALVAMGCGVGVVPKLVLESSALRDRVVEVDVRPRLPAFRIGMCVRRRALALPLVAALWEEAAAG